MVYSRLKQIGLVPLAGVGTAIVLAGAGWSGIPLSDYIFDKRVVIYGDSVDALALTMLTGIIGLLVGLISAVFKLRRLAGMIVGAVIGISVWPLFIFLRSISSFQRPPERFDFYLIFGGLILAYMIGGGLTGIVCGIFNRRILSAPVIGEIDEIDAPPSPAHFDFTG